jgi:hypothetical protein
VFLAGEGGGAHILSMRGIISLATLPEAPKRRTRVAAIVASCKRMLIGEETTGGDK